MAMVGLYAALMGLSGLFALPPLDRDEARFVQATTQMLETGDYLNIRYQELERNKKPAGIYWLQAASVSAFSDVEDRQIWAYRLPSLFSAILAAMLIYGLGTFLFSERAGFWAALLMASAPVFAGESGIAKTDATLLFTVMLAQISLARLFLNFRQNPDAPSSWVSALMFWFALGFGILIKGPITPMISFFTLAALALIGQIGWLKFTRALKPISGLLLVSLMVVPWALAINHTTDGRFFNEAVGTDMLGKVTAKQERHGGPPGYHLIALWFFFWPAALFLPSALARSVKKWRTPAFIFILGWLVPAWLVFEFTATKLPHYTLPLYPALSFLVATMVTDPHHKNGPLGKLLGSLLYALPTAVLAAIMIALPADYSAQGPTALHYGFAALVALGGLAGIGLFWRNQMRIALLVTMLTSFMGLWILFDGVLRQLDAFQLSPIMSEILIENDLHPLRNHKPPVALVGYHEPSAVFLLGTKTLLTDAKGAADYLASAPGLVAIVDAREKEAFMAALQGTQIEPFDQIDGTDYSNGKEMKLTFYRSR